MLHSRVHLVADENGAIVACEEAEDAATAIAAAAAAVVVVAVEARHHYRRVSDEDLASCTTMNGAMDSAAVREP